VENKLTMTKVNAAKRGGYLADGGGLHLQVTANKAGAVRKSWVYRFLSPTRGKSREMGLGPLAGDFGLAEARAKRNEWREVVKSGLDAIDERERRSQNAAMEAAHTVSFRQAVEGFMTANADRWRATATKDDWQSEFDNYAIPTLGLLPIREIGPALIDRVLEPIWARPVLGKRLRSRMEEIFDWAAARGFRDPHTNPCVYKRVVQALGRRQKHPPEHYAALPVDEIGALVAELRAKQAAEPNNLSHHAIEFAVLTVSRIGQVTKARWKEIDFATATWNVPDPQTKSGRPFRIPLCPRALTLLKNLPGTHDPDSYVFFGAHPSKPCGRNTFRIVLKRLRPDITIHGMRSCFKDWSETKTRFPSKLAEAALDHVRGDATERAYARDDLLQQRRPLILAWQQFVDRPTKPATVTPIGPHVVAAG
jgi:integrase